MALQFLSELDQLDDKFETTFSLPTDLTVAEVVQSDILRCAADLPLSEAAAIMQERRCSSILVMENGLPTGIWTERDALAVDFSDPGQFSLAIGAVMSSPVVSIPGSTLLRTAAPLLRHNGFRHFLVVDDGQKPLGILSQTDVVVHQGIEHYLHLRTVGSVVRRDIPRLAAELPLAEAVRTMRQQVTDAVLVAYTDGGYGILTERDLVRLIAQAPTCQTVGELASRPLHAVPQDLSLYRARALLTRSQIRHIGVLDDAELLGLVSFAEIMMDIEVAYVRELQQALQVRDRALAASRRSLRLAERIIENTREGVMITDVDGHIVSVNPAFSRLTGYTEQEVIGQRPSILSSGHQDQQFYNAMWQDLHTHGHWEGEIWNRKKSGEVFPEFLTITAITDEQGEVSHYAGLFNDITQLKENEADIRNLAYRDPLTGLPNRRLLDDRLEMAIARAHRHGTRVGVMFVDLDRFKQLNDTLGHAAGDTVLVELARRLQNCVREDDTVARLGGDEFVIVLANIGDAAEARQTAARVIAALRTPLLLQGQQLVVTCSLGISVYPDDGTDREALLKHADTAMYQVKGSGGNGSATAGT